MEARDENVCEIHPIGSCIREKTHSLSYSVFNTRLPYFQRGIIIHNAQHCYNQTNSAENLHVIKLCETPYSSTARVAQGTYFQAAMTSNIYLVICPRKGSIGTLDIS